MKKRSNLLLIAALILSHLMCVVVAFSYRDMLCCIEHSLCSAPAWIAFLYALPFGICIFVCVVLALIIRRKAK